MYPMSIDTPRYGVVDRDYAMQLAAASPGEDGPVWMVNLMKYRQMADYADGRETTISGRDADDIYAPLKSLATVGAEIVFVGDVDQQLLGDNTTWDRIAVVKYPTRRSFIAMQTLPEFQESHKHKDAGMDQTIVMGCQPLTVPSTSDLRFTDWSNVPHPSTDVDGPVVVLHVLQFDNMESETQTPTYMQSCQSVVARVALKHGLRISGWFYVEGTIVGDQRRWNQVRFNLFPSKAAFLAFDSDPDRLQAQKVHCKQAIGDIYTMIVRPTINRLNESAQI